MLRCSAIILLIAFCAYCFWPFYYERNQCTRKCRWENSKSNYRLNLDDIEGEIIDFWNPVECKCSDPINENVKLPVTKTKRLNEYNDWRWHYDDDRECVVNNEVINCGPCGKCSNKNDIKIWNKLKFNMTSIARNCAILALIPPSFVGASLSGKCFKYFTLFTDECVDCWIDNFVCTSIHCSSICIQELLFNIDWNQENNDNKGSGKLSECLHCDEYVCGPQYLDCVGANRRSSGLYSDINRNNTQICTKTKLYKKYHST